jgi:hypothetical protein
MSHARKLTLALLTVAAIGCGSRNTPPPPLEISADPALATTEEKLPYVDPSLPAGDIEAAQEEERKRFMKIQEAKMNEQKQQVDDLKRQKYQDDYYRSRYPSSN